MDKKAIYKLSYGLFVLTAIEDIKKAVDEIWRLQRRTLLNQP